MYLKAMEGNAAGTGAAIHAKLRRHVRKCCGDLRNWLRLAHTQKADFSLRATANSVPDVQQSKTALELRIA